MPDLLISTAITRKIKMVMTLWDCTRSRKEAVRRETLISTKALAGIVVDLTTLPIALRTNRLTVGPLMVAKEQEKEKIPRVRVKEESLRAKAAKVAARVERKAKAAEKVRKEKVKVKERFSDLTMP